MISLDLIGLSFFVFHEADFIYWVIVTQFYLKIALGSMKQFVVVWKIPQILINKLDKVKY